MGTIEDTKHVIPSHIADGTLFDICAEAQTETLFAGGGQYVLYDDCGRITLKRLENMLVTFENGTSCLLIDRDTAGSWTLKSDIDSETYDRIVFRYDNGQTGERELTIANDSAAQAKWGVLTHFEEADEALLPRVKQWADRLLDYYSRPKRTFSVSDCPGVPSVRGGSVLVVSFDIGGAKLTQFMAVEKVEHVFTDNSHLMSLNLFGGDFDA